MQEYEILRQKSLTDLREIAKTMGITKIASLRKNELIECIIKNSQSHNDAEENFDEKT